MKSNPLFVDSTKFRGDPVSTQFELKNALFYDDEHLYVMVTNHQGVTRRVQMRASEERGYEGRVHLNHQTSIQYQFVIEKDGTCVMLSPVYKGKAQYAIIQDWQGPADRDTTELLQETPLVNSGALAAPPSGHLSNKPAATVPATQANAQGAAWARESSIAVRSLIEKWGL